MSKKTLYQFLRNEISYQNQALFEFRYPVLFDEDSFMIDQLNFPKLDTNMGYIYLDGYRIPVHSTGLFDNEISFSLYVNENDLHYNGKYFKIFNSILDKNHELPYNEFTQNTNTITPIIAYITPLSTSINMESSDLKSDTNNRTILLYNALIKSIGLQGGFSSNSTALAKFDVTMTYSFFSHNDRRFDEYSGW